MIFSYLFFILREFYYDILEMLIHLLCQCLIYKNMKILIEILTWTQI